MDTTAVTVPQKLETETSTKRIKRTDQANSGCGEAKQVDLMSTTEVNGSMSDVNVSLMTGTSTEDCSKQSTPLRRKRKACKKSPFSSKRRRKQQKHGNSRTDTIGEITGGETAAFIDNKPKNSPLPETEGNQYAHYQKNDHVPDHGFFLFQEEPLRFIGDKSHIQMMNKGWKVVEIVNEDDDKTPCSPRSVAVKSTSSSVKDANMSNNDHLDSSGILEMATLHVSACRDQLSLKWPSIVAYDGMVESITAIGKKQPSQSDSDNRSNKNNQKQSTDSNTNTPKSDLLCLLGLLKLFPHVVAIKSIQILVPSTRQKMELQKSNNNSFSLGNELRYLGSKKKSPDCESYTNTNMDCAVLVTVGFPQLTISTTTRLSSGCSILPPCSVRGGAAKVLHPALQIILQTIRSDWEYLDEVTNELLTDDPGTSFTSPLNAPNQNGLRQQQQQQEDDFQQQAFEEEVRKQRRRRGRFFPAGISLEKLYLRIENAGSYPQRFGNSNISRSTNSGCPLILLLPQEILAEQIAPFLRSKSLDALRCSCSFLHNTLKAVVPGIPRLRLYQHQISSLTWMRGRETQKVSETDLLRTSVPIDQPARANQCGSDGDWHRAVTAGQSTILRTRDGTWSCRLHQATGNEFQVNGSMRRSVARGGLLADEPGLGKTITVLSLILQTSGLTTRQEIETISNDDGSPCRIAREHKRASSEEEIFRAYWKESIPPHYRRTDLLSLVNRFIQSNKAAIKIPVAAIKTQIAEDAYGDDFDNFVHNISDQILSSFSDEPEKENGELLHKRFLETVHNYKKKQLLSAAKSCSKARIDSSVAALYEAYNHRMFIESLVNSKATLIVVPLVLLDHWREQIEAHVDFSYITQNKPMTFEFMGNLDDCTDVVDKIWTQKTHEPVLFIDRVPSKPLPDANFLSAFHIVITSNNRLTQEWKNGSFQEEINRMSEEAHNTDAHELNAFEKLNRGGSACPLLKVHWLRLIVDEGHSMGRTQQNASVGFASWISAERRWAMTGTPAKHGSGGITQILALLRFIQHDFFTHRCDGDSHWRNFVARPWRTGDLSGFYRLRSLLGVLMKRHTKADIVELPPPPASKCTAVPMSSSEVEAYNSIATAVQINLVLTSLTDDGWQDSLLHVSNRKHAFLALANLRRVCVGYSRVIPSLTDDAWNETVELADKYGFSDQARSNLKEYMTRAVKGGLSECNCCGINLSVLLINPCCGALICTDCVTTELDSCNFLECLICSRSFDVNTLQRFQPGFVMEWLENLHQNASTNRDIGPNIPTHGTPIPVAVHVDQGGIGPIIRPPQERRRTRKFGDGHTCQYDRFSVNGRCILCFAEHEACNLLATGRCHVCHRLAIECPEEESKSSYLVSKLLDLAGSSATFEGRPLKVIVFSQYRGALNLTGTHLLRRFGVACVAEYWGRYRTQELRKFSHSEECFCMLLGKDGSEGLDLSFVTHIFFLEEIWDRTLADQTVSRAWRMGARGRVQVETLVAENSVEETMAEYERTTITRDRRTAAELASSKEYQAAKTHALLRSLKYMTSYQSFRKNGESQQPPPGTGIFEENKSPVKRLEHVNEHWKRLHSSSGERNDGENDRKNKCSRRVCFNAFKHE